MLIWGEVARLPRSQVSIKAIDILIQRGLVARCCIGITGRRAPSNVTITTGILGFFDERGDRRSINFLRASGSISFLGMSVLTIFCWISIDSAGIILYDCGIRF
jgi:hypothetical protein